MAAGLGDLIYSRGELARISDDPARGADQSAHELVGLIVPASAAALSGIPPDRIRAVS
jgi:hypothetical protein